MKRVLLASIGILALFGSANAADLGARYPAPIAKAPVYAPVYNWTGFYIGINGGGGWGRSTWNGAPATFDLSGGLIGGTLGYNWQMGQIVYGLEGDGDWANIKGSTRSGACLTFACTTRTDFLATVRGRLGYAFDRFMPYVTGGLALGNIKATSPTFAAVDNTNAGWTAGGGLEFAVVNNWTVKAEYLHVDLGSTTCPIASACSFVAGNKVTLTEDLVRGGVNYRF